jgi:hypothetical protein
MPKPPPSTRRPSLRVASAVLALAIVLGGCGSSGDSTPGPTPDDPTVASTTPADEATGVSIGAAIVVEFSEAMDTTSAEGAFGASPPVSCTFSWNADDTRLTCDPDADLAATTEYTVTIAGDATDAEGDTLGSDATFTFTTGAAVTEDCTFGTSTFGACRFAP